MELTDFLTVDFLKTFSGTLVSVELIVSVTKELPMIKKIPTRIYTFFLALAHLIIIKTSTGTIKYDVTSFYLLFLNSIIVAIILCGGYDTILTKINEIKKRANIEEAVKEVPNNNDLQEIIKDENPEIEVKEIIKDKSSDSDDELVKY